MDDLTHGRVNAGFAESLEFDFEWEDLLRAAAFEVSSEEPHGLYPVRAVGDLVAWLKHHSYRDVA